MWDFQCFILALSNTQEEFDFKDSENKQLSFYLQHFNKKMIVLCVYQLSNNMRVSRTWVPSYWWQELLTKKLVVSIKCTPVCVPPVVR